MPLYIDVHRTLKGLDAESSVRAFSADRETQRQHGVTYLKCWYEEDKGNVLCLVAAPTRHAAASVHRQVHGHGGCEVAELPEEALWRPNLAELAPGEAAPMRRATPPEQSASRRRLTAACCAR
jgi:Protein of unknown function (DUF4242)